MDEVKRKLIDNGFKGDLEDNEESLSYYSHDASMFEIKPQLIIFPKSKEDVSIAVRTVNECKDKIQDLSLTARSAGTDMSGAAINDSIIIDVKKYLNKFVKFENKIASVQPGFMYRDLEKHTGDYELPSYPASRDYASIGGFVNNNSGGEKSLKYGKTDQYVKSIQFVFSDGIERTVKPLTKFELEKKIEQKDFEGKVYRDMYKLVSSNYEIIKRAKPKVTKNSTGYHLWDVWNKEKGIFDLTKVIVGGQGTLGICTETSIELVQKQKHSGLLIIFLDNIDNLGDLIKQVVEEKPVAFEGFDDSTLLLSIRFMPSFLKMLGIKKFLHLIISLIPDAFQLLKGIPKLTLMVQFEGSSEDEVRNKIHSLHEKLKNKKVIYEINGFEETPTEYKSQKFWIMRRNSFQLLRSKIRNKHTAPFIDDLVVNPEHLPEFLPKIRKIIKKYKLFATIQGHLGDGNFHIIPLMEIQRESERKKILPAMKEVNNLVLYYKGSLSGEHNDGLIRGPWLKFMYGEEILDLFKQTKNIFDPKGIFNPNKKANANWEYSYSHIRKDFEETRSWKEK